MDSLALLFPGQGTQYMGMGKKATEHYPVAAHVFEEANDALGFDLKKIIFQGTMPELTHSANAQPAVVTVNYAFYKIFMQEFGIIPAYCAGHSLGEISALIASGAIRFRDGVKFARRRGFIMHEAFTRKTGGAAIVRKVREEWLEYEISLIRSIAGHVSVSAYNSPEQFLISGTEDAIKEVAKKVRNTGGEFIPYKMVAMKVDAPFHCEMMRFLEEKLEKQLHSYTYAPLHCDVIANIDARPYINHGDIPTKLSLQLTHPVKWRQTLAYLQENGITHALEIGPMNVLKGLSEENKTGFKTFSWDMSGDKDEFKRAWRVNEREKRLIHTDDVCYRAENMLN